MCESGVGKMEVGSFAGVWVNITLTTLHTTLVIKTFKIPFLLLVYSDPAEQCINHKQDI